MLHAFRKSHVSADALCSQLGIIAVEADKRGVWESCSHLFEWETDDDGRVEYSLTGTGRSLMPAIIALIDWGKEHFDEVVTD